MNPKRKSDLLQRKHVYNFRVDLVLPGNPVLKKQVITNNRAEGNFLVEQSIKIGKPFIFVTFNYRVGYYGWICSKELKAEAISQGEEGWANQGLYDQRLALEWVKQSHHSLLP